ncbi:MAG TPA: hypothetical protein VNA88_13820 [Candidatus Kapabacteria bacterium]|nr:hypothetical protein [Candidatus Kapabacteria bacterium]
MPFQRFLLSTLALVLVTTSALAQTAFIENRGQWDPRARFLASLGGVDAWITDDGIVYDFHRDSVGLAPSVDEGAYRPAPVRRSGHVVAMRFVGAGGRAIARPEHRAAGTHNYFLGNDPSRWARNVARFDEVSIGSIRDGIDARVHIDGGSLRYDLIVAPGADPSSVAIAFDGALGVRVDERGELQIATSLGEISHRGLYAYQMHGAVRSRVDCAFAPRADGTVGFTVGEYDRARPLVIDPLVWSRYVGHAGESSAATMAVDSIGTVFIAGSLVLQGYPTSLGAYDNSWNGETDVVVTRLEPGGAQLGYSTYIGGTLFDWASRIAIDRAGFAYLAIMTGSTDFPTTAGAFDESFNGGSLDGVVLKLDQTGSTLVYSTHLGGTETEDGLDIAVDATGAVFVSGWTDSRDFPTTGGVIASTYNGGTTDGFVARVEPNGASLGFSTFLGGGSSDHPTSIALDSIGAFFVGGYTESTDYPTTPGVIKRTLGGPQDAFVTKINPVASVIMYSTFIGGTTHEGLALLEVDAAGEVFMAGQTASSDFPTTPGCYQTARGSQYVVRIDPLGTTLRYATYLGAINDRVGAASLARAGFFCVSGATSSRVYPTSADAVTRGYGGGSTDAYVTIVRPSGATLSYSTYLGGSAGDVGLGIGLDRRGDVYTSGGTASPNFPNTIAGSRAEGLTDFFVAKIGRCLVEAHAGRDRTICQGDAVEIGAVATGGIPEYRYRWRANGVALAADTAVMTVRPETTTVYIVTAEDFVGCDDVDTVVVTVNPAPLVAAGADTAVCAGSSVRIGNPATSGTPPFVYLWQPAAGLSSTRAAQPTARPDSTTSYVVVVTDAKGCTATDTIVVSINRPPVLEPPTAYEICAGDSATLGVTIASGAGPFTYLWTPATGLSSTSVADPRAAPAATTSYRVTVTDANGCSTTSAPMTVTVGSTLRTRIAASGSTRLCPGESVTLDAGDFAQYLWSSGATSRSIVVTTPGRYWVAVTSASGCTGGSDTVQVAAGAPADASFTGATSACPGTLAEYTAAAPAGSTLTWRLDAARGTIESAAGTSPLRVRWSVPGRDTVRLVVASADGCVDSTFVAVTVVAALSPTITPSGATALCSGDSVTLDAGAGFATHTWSNGASTRTIVVREAGDYWVDVTDAGGCGGRSDTVRVVVRPLPAPEITALGTEICAGDSAVLVASPGFDRYDWSNGMTGQRIAVTEAGSYSVTVVDANGCRGVSAPVAIVVHPLPAPPSITQSGDTLIASDAAAWQWLLENVPIDGATARRHVRTDPGSYAVEITDSNGCRSRATVETAERHFAWVDSTSAKLGDRFTVAFIVDPPLRASDGVTAYTVMLRIDPRDLFAHAVRAARSSPGMPLPTLAAGELGGIELRYTGPTAVTGDTLFLLELQGLSTAKPVSPILVGDLDFGRAADVRRAGDGLVLLEGCDVGTFAAGKRVHITSARVDASSGEIVVRYGAPSAARPTLHLLDAAGRSVETMRLEQGIDLEQEARLRVPESGLYIIELRDRAERSATPIVVTR